MVSGPQVIARDDALRELPQFRARQHRGELRLAEQDDLQQLALVRFQIGEQPHLLQHVGREILRLVDDQHRVPAPGMGVEQVVVDAVDEHLDAGIAGRVGDAEFDADGREQFLHRQLGVEDVGDIAGFRNLLEQAAADGRLARSDLAGEQDESAIAAHAVEQVRERLLVALAQVEVARVRRNGERRFGEAKVALVHECRKVVEPSLCRAVPAARGLLTREAPPQRSPLSFRGE